VLERVRELLSPFRLPRRLLVKTEGCDGVSNAWYENNAITVCYEYLDDLWKNVPQQTTAAGVTPIDGLVGPVLDVFLHEAGHAMFDMLKIPLFGREEDAADQFSIYIMLKAPKDEARRLIVGNAYQYKGDLKSPTVTMSLKNFSDAHGTPSQRFFNVLCMAYGADPELFKDFAASGFLPQDRAEYCEGEFEQVAYAFTRLIMPHVDQRLAKKLHRNWLPDSKIQPKRKQTVPPRAAAQ